MRGQAMLLAGALFAAGLGAPETASANGYGQTYGQSYGRAPVYEDPWCKQQRQNRMLIGGAIGAVAGAVLGNNIAARNAQSEGSILGGVAGAAAGAAIGRNTVQCAAPYPQTGYGGQGAYGYGQSGGYGYADPNLAGGPGYRRGY